MANPGKRQGRGAEAISPHYDIRLPKLPWHRRVQIPIIAAAVFSVIRTVGPTLRFEVVGGAQHEALLGSEEAEHLGFLASRDLPITWYARNRGIVVMNTTAFDGPVDPQGDRVAGLRHRPGQLLARRLTRLASHGKRIEEGLDCAFTIDGPRGPRYVAKVGRCCSRA